MTVISREVVPHASLRVQRIDVMTSVGPVGCPVTPARLSLVLGAQCLWSCEAPVRELNRGPSPARFQQTGPHLSDPIAATGVTLVHLQWRPGELATHFSTAISELTERNRQGPCGHNISNPRGAHGIDAPASKNRRVLTLYWLTPITEACIQQPCPSHYTARTRARPTTPARC